MSIKVIYFASLRDSLNKSQDKVDYSAGLTVATLWKELNGDRPEEGSILVAVNHEYADFDHPLNDRDEVAFFPPVTGG